MASTSANATPPVYSTFEREQRASHAPDPRHLLRIWAIYSGQGDSFLIQFPTAFTQGGQSVEMLVDGGPRGQHVAVFLNRLLGDDCCSIEYAVLTHHDADHVGGLTSLLARQNVGLDTIFHNGLVSWEPSSASFANVTPQSNSALFHSDGKRVMALYENEGTRLRARDLMQSRADLKRAFDAQALQGVYLAFADAILSKTVPASVTKFSAFDNQAGALPVFAAVSGAPMLQLEGLWPPPDRRVYEGSSGIWAYTVNGNSVTFRLTYGEFQMLFTGDHNDASEAELLDEIDHRRLSADVLKIPHHGSAHSLETFVSAVDPVISVASMGNNTYGHPALNAIDWAGGAHRVYHTHIHERKFTYVHGSKKVPEAMVEGSHVLIETDGAWFRVAETQDPLAVPTVKATRRGNGTQWIKANP